MVVLDNVLEAIV